MFVVVSLDQLTTEPVFESEFLYESISQCKSLYKDNVNLYTKFGRSDGAAQIHLGKSLNLLEDVTTNPKIRVVAKLLSMVKCELRKFYPPCVLQRPKLKDLCSLFTNSNCLLGLRTLKIRLIHMLCSNAP